MEDLKVLVIEIRNLIKALDDPLGKEVRRLEHYNVNEVAEILHCSPVTVRNILRDNEMKALIYRGTIRVSKANLEKFITKHTS